MPPAWSVILLTTLIGAAQGLFLAVVAADGFRRAPPAFVQLSCAISLLLLAGGLAALFWHLGRAGQAWRAAARWRTSWRSREAIALPAFTATVAAYGGASYLALGRDVCLAIGGAGTVLCMALFLCTGMVYACQKFVQEWHTPLTPLNFLLLGCTSGLTLAVPLAVVAFPNFAGVFALAAFSLGCVAYLMRCTALLRNARLRRKSARATAIGVEDAKPAQMLRAARWAFLIFAFPLPGWLLGWGGGTLHAYTAAFVLQLGGLLAARWLFFAEARPTA